jgi:glycosyltransferase involved in cell wall biosynthesis
VSKSIQKLSKSLAVIVPTYNAGGLVKDVVNALEDYVHTVWVVNDGSTDGCTDDLKSDVTRVLDLPENHGKGYALVQGYRKALEDDSIQCVAVLDADGQHDARDLPRLYETYLREEADFLIGSRDFVMGYVPLRSRIGNQVTLVVSGLMLGAWLKDTQSGFRLVSRKYLEEVLPTITGGRYETEMEMIAKAVHGDFKVASEPIRTIYDEGNKSSHFHVVRDSFLIYTKLISIGIKNLFS